MAVFRRKRELTIGRSAAAGAVGGMVGAAAMIGFAVAWQRVFPIPRRSQLLPSPEQDMDALVRGLRAVFGNVSQPTLKRLARGGHFAFGTGLGAAYGAIAAMRGRNGYAHALAFAATEELVGNEVLGRPLGLTMKPSLYPGTERVHSLVSHLLWAAVTETVFRKLKGRERRPLGGLRLVWSRGPARALRAVRLV